MTAQVPDSVWLDGQEFVIAGVDGGRLFDPTDHQLRPAMISTACWRGYVCSYAVAAHQLVLDELVVGMESTIDGREVVTGARFLGGDAEQDDSQSCYVFRDLGWPVPFTGGLLLGDGFVESTYVHMGFHPAWKYERVVELVVEDGRVQSVRDRSDEVARIRRAIETGEREDPDGARGGIGWIQRTFKFDYTRTFGRS
jgi:hypothetical protein